LLPKTHNLLLLALSLGVATLATLGIFTLNEHLSKARERISATNDKIMLAIFSIIAGTALWLNHLLLAYATYSQFKPTLAPIMLIIGWFFAIATCLVVLDTTSKPHLSLKRFASGAPLISLLVLGMFFADWRANMEFSQFGFKRAELLLAYLVSTIVIIGNLLTFFWMKNYHGNYRKTIKTVLAIICGLSIIAIHIAYNQAIYTINSTITANAYNGIFSHKVAAIIITLLLVCLFTFVFTVVLVYERHQLRRQQTEPTIIETAENLDALTSLPSRKAFETHLDGAAKRCQRSSKTIAIAYIDLDHFKPVNDQLGHHVGDTVLTLVAQRLNTAIRSCDYAARIGGDEFVVLFENIVTEDDITPIVQRIVTSIKEPFHANGHHIHISCSVGIAIYPHDGDTSGLMVRADTAMYKAKESGKNQFKFFDEEIERASSQMRDMQTDLLAALSENQLKLMFLPKVYCRTFSPAGAEAIVCWQHPEQGLLMPEQFLPAAERFGLINQINHWALEECCKVLAKVSERQTPLQLSMNLSAVQFRRPDLINDILQTFHSYQLRTDIMIFEIKEINSIQNKTQLHQQFEQFRKAHIKISLDDFGSQSFSLDSLQSLNVDEVKLDKSFISQVEHDKTARSLVDAVIRLSHALNLNVVACGVENDMQSNLLKEMGCDQMQGYLLSRPLTQEGLLSMFGQLHSKYESTGQFQPSDYRTEAA
jgi:diguanylate cyclase (GGDEF)-like protein